MKTIRTLVYISGITGGLVVILRTIGIFMEISFNNILLYAGIFLLGFICLPLSMIYQKKQIKKINRIINANKNKNKEKKQIKRTDSKTNGWNMNSSPFRKRKSGLTWGGGNIKGSNAEGNVRRSFLKK